tara:strand:+ start:896 stop:1006 length:111 start_codon:yes stop_codon:yes gene_type:complete
MSSLKQKNIQELIAASVMFRFEAKLDQLKKPYTKKE